VTGTSLFSTMEAGVRLGQPEDPVERLEIDLFKAALALSASLLLVQRLHWRPSALLTHGGLSMLTGVAVNAGVWAFTSIVCGRPQLISLVASSGVHDVIYFGLIPPIIFEAGFSMRYCRAARTRALSFPVPVHPRWSPTHSARARCPT
jgi:hypothetical protein